MSGRPSVRVGDKMKYGFWLVFTKTGNLRMTRTQPNVDRTERAMSVELSVPIALFEQPNLRATIAVEDAGLPVPQIDIQAAGAALRSAIGCDVDMIVLETTK